MTDFETPQIGENTLDGKELVPYEQAKKEVYNWLHDTVGLTTPEYETQKTLIDRVISNVQEGHISFSDDHIVQKLKAPLHKEDGSLHLDTLKYHNRVRAHVIKSKTQNISMTDIDGRHLAIASALTEVGTGVLGKLQNKDFRILKDIAGFFI